MSHNIWEELARSPLDPDPNHEPSLLEQLLPFGIAAGLGLLIGVFLLGGAGDTPESTTTVLAATTTTATAPDLEPEVPDAYHDIDGVGLRALSAYSRSGNLYIVVNEVTRSDQDPVEANAFHPASWVLSGDGIETTAARSIRSHLSPGMHVVEFLGIAGLPVAGAVLFVRRASEMVVRTGWQGCGAVSANEATGEVPLDGIERPYLLGQPILIDVGGAITLSIDRLEFTDDWGYVEWHIIDENDARIRADLRVIFAGTDDPAFDGINPTQLIPDSSFGPSQQNPTMANPRSFTRSGELLLDRVGELISADNTPTSLTLGWSVEWLHPVGDPVTLPLSDLGDLGIID